jgi:hypothetical protein
VFDAQILGKYQVEYHHCDRCGLLQTEAPYWLEEAYSSAINVSDTGVMARSIAQSRTVSSIILTCFDRHARFVDHGGGYGIFTRLMRDRGFDYYWADPQAKNLVARGFEFDGSGAVEAVTSLETFEHFVEPREEIAKILRISDSVIFSTELRPEKVPNPEEWWYYGREHGQHIAFYSRKTMEHIGKVFGLNYYYCGSLHLMVPERLSQRRLDLISKLPEPLIDLWNRWTMPSRTRSDMDTVVERFKLGSKK